mmetsp:Transcript_21858/g.64518  ORF Transcript_21858/g.64518 Transcript_21858/m.64518 type:complete len:540 (-) Transcript_21858:387-2006(-)
MGGVMWKRILGAILAAAVVATDNRHAASAFHASPLLTAPASASIAGKPALSSRWTTCARPSASGRGKAFCRLQSSPSSTASAAAAEADSDSDSDSEEEEIASSRRTYKHTLAILTLPRTSADRIANEAILETAMSRTSHRLSVVLRCSSSSYSSSSYDRSPAPTLSQLREYVGEVYTSAWDITLGFDDARRELSGELLDVIVYPQNLPNAAPEKWIQRRPDLDGVCSHDSITGWSSVGASGTGVGYSAVEGNGVGGLDAHVEAINADRASRGLGSVTALTVDPWPVGAEVREDDHVVFLDDSAAENLKRWEGGGGGGEGEKRKGDDDDDGDEGTTTADTSALIGGPRVRDRSLYDSVCVGGTFDGMHYGHRKLLTLAASSVRPQTGKLLIGITRDEMLSSKSYAELIPDLDERVRGVHEFVDNLAPGLKNRVRIVPIDDAYGPPGAGPHPDPTDELSGGGNIKHGGGGGHNKNIPNDFDALVLSHETLPTGKKLNEHRVNDLGLEPLMLLCTRRTEPHGMSSTALRRMRKGVRPEANMI